MHTGIHALTCARKDGQDKDSIAWWCGPNAYADLLWQKTLYLSLSLSLFLALALYQNGKKQNNLLRKEIAEKNQRSIIEESLFTACNIYWKTVYTMFSVMCPYCGIIVALYFRHPSILNSSSWKTSGFNINTRILYSNTHTQRNNPTAQFLVSASHSLRAYPKTFSYYYTHIPGRI